MIMRDMIRASHATPKLPKRHVASGRPLYLLLDWAGAPGQSAGGRDAQQAGKQCIDMTMSQENCYVGSRLDRGPRLTGVVGKVRGAS